MKNSCSIPKEFEPKELSGPFRRFDPPAEQEPLWDDTPPSTMGQVLEFMRVKGLITERFAVVGSEKVRIHLWGVQGDRTLVLVQTVRPFGRRSFVKWSCVEKPFKAVLTHYADLTLKRKAA